MNTNYVLDFSAKAKAAKKMSVDSLMFVINDCMEAIKVNPTADKVVCGYYHDEMSVMRAELKRRDLKHRGVL
jgi:hypothetical protein